MEASFYPQILTIFLGLLIWLSQRQAHPQDSSSQGSSDEWVAQFWNLYNMSCCVEQDQVAQNISDQEVTGIWQFVQASESWSTNAPKSQMKRNKENQDLEYLHPCIPSLSFPVATSKEKFAVWVQGMWDQVGLVVLYPVGLLKPADANGSILCL